MWISVLGPGSLVRRLLDWDASALAASSTSRTMEDTFVTVALEKAGERNLSSKYQIDGATVSQLRKLQ